MENNNNSNQEKPKNNNQNQKKDNGRPKKEPILDLSKYQDKKIRVSFVHGREITGILKGYDQLMNLVLDEVEELNVPISGKGHEEEPEVKRYDAKTRKLGFVVVRSALLLTISPEDGSEIIENPLQLQNAEQAAVI